MCHTTHGRLTGLALDDLLMIQAALRGEVMLKTDPGALRITNSLEYGASAALLRLAKDIGLDKALYSRPHEPWVQDCLAMIVGRIVYQGSKLALSQSTAYSALWSLCGSEGPVDVNEHCYASMDRLLERQHAIEKHLAAKHLTNGTLVLYDITSSYFEGEYEASEIVMFGHDRDHKDGHEQIVIGLITTAEGCPVCVEVFPGNTQDASTVIEKVREELGELQDEIDKGDRTRTHEELGDLLFALSQAARHLGVDAEAALRDANAKFERRFRQVEAHLAAEGRTPADVGMEQLEALWVRAKRELG